jgi:hypothetical protein
MKLADREAQKRYTAERQAHRDRIHRRRVLTVLTWMARWGR